MQKSGTKSGFCSLVFTEIKAKYYFDVLKGLKSSNNFF
jgi:hypothetical protein